MQDTCGYLSPAANELRPLGIVVGVATEHVSRAHGRFLGDMEQPHAGFFRTATTLVMVAVRAGRDHVRPDVQATLIPGNNVVNGQTRVATTAVLAGEVVSSKDLAAGKLHVRAWASYLLLKPNDRRPRQCNRDRVQVAPSVGNHGSLAPEDKHHGASRRADVDGLEVGIEDKYGLVHGSSAISAIIA